MSNSRCAINVSNKSAYFQHSHIVGHLDSIVKQGSLNHEIELRTIISILVFFISFVSSAQLPWTENFEGGPGSNPWTAISASECNDGSYDYFTITNGSDIGASYAGNSSTYFFATQDMNGAGCGHTGVEEITWDIDISSCTSGSFDFSVLLADDNNGWPSQGWDNNDYVHIYYSIDGGAEQNLLWVESDNSATETQAYIDTDFDGVGDGSLVGDSFSSFTSSISGTGTTLTIRIEFGISESYVDLAIDDLSVSCSVPANTIGITTVASSSYTVDCSTSTTDSGTIDFTSTGTYNAGNLYTVELSDASGSFVNPIEVASLLSTANSGSISFSIPDNVPSGNGYRIRIVSSNPSVTSPDNGTNISITQSGSCIPPHISSIIINSCQFSGCSEGHNEIVFGNTGDYSLEVTPSNFDFLYESSYPPTDDYTSSLTTNTATTSTLNTEAGCAGLFVEGSFETMPPDASFMLVRSTICPGAMDWSSLCGAGPIYVIYTTDPTWQTSGNFNNSADGMRYFEFNPTTTLGESFSLEYDYNSDDLTLHADGDYVTFAETGGSATNYNNTGCSLTVDVLSSELVRLHAYFTDPTNTLYWETQSETNNDYFKIERSSNLHNWNIVGAVDGSGTTDLAVQYSFEDIKPYPGINYYRLFSVDVDGKQHNKGIVSVETDFEFAYFNPATNIIHLHSESDIEIVSTDGRILYQGQNISKISFDRKGIFLIRDTKRGTTERILTY